MLTYTLVYTCFTAFLMLYILVYIVLIALRIASHNPKALSLTHYQDNPEPTQNLRRVFRNAWPLTHGPMLSG